MPDDRNLFDDDSLFPDWLKGMEEQASDDEESSAPGSDSPPWMQKPGEKPPAPTSNLAPPPWMQQNEPLKPPTGPLEVLPWSTPAAESGAPAEAEENAFQWDDTSPKTPGRTGGEIPRGLTSALPWMDADEQRPGGREQFTMDDLLGDFDAEPSQEPEQADWMSSFGQAASFDMNAPAADDSDWLTPSEPPQASELPSWLDENAFEMPAAESAPQEPPQASELPSWLDESAFETPAAQEPPPPAAPPKAPSVIRRIRPADDFQPPQQPAPPPPEETAEPDWLGMTENTFDAADSTFGDFGTPDAPADLSYEEWEQLQYEREIEEQKTPEDRLMEEVPDWFDKITPEGKAPPPPTPTEKPSEPEFVPGWFLGLEDQNPDEAPDWFQKIDYSNEPLAELPPEQPAAAPEPSADDLPDWFKGVETPAVEGLDWGTAFGAPSAPQETPDWMAETPSGDLPLPDMDALLGETTPGEIPDWLADAAPQSNMIAQPEDIPFPDLDLDQGVQGADEGLEDWMIQFAPEEEPEASPLLRSRKPPVEEDFVERFDPLEPQMSTPAPIDEDAPDWLRDMAMDEPPDLFSEPTAPREMVPEPREPSSFGDELDWLTGISADDVTFEPPEEPKAAAPEVRPAKPPASEEPVFDSRAIDQLLGLYTPPSEPQAEPEPELTWEDELPIEEETPAAEESFEIFGVPTEWDEETVDLAELLSDDDLEKTLPFPPEPSRPELELPSAEVQPGWVAEIRPSDLPVTVKVGGVEVSVKQKQVFELPDRLRTFHDISQQEVPPPAAPPAPAAGPLAGIEGALPLVDIGLARETITPTHGLVVTPEQQIRVNRLQTLLDLAVGEEEAEDELEDVLEPGRFSFEEGTEPEIEIQPRLRRRSRFKPDRVLISLLLFAGLIIPFITDAVHFAADPPALGSRQQDVAAEVDQLAAGDYVLFALEYGPTAAGELDPLAEAVLRDVLSRGAVPLTISTNPAGALHAESVLKPLVNDERLLAARGQNEAKLEAGEDYILLSYLSGEAVGVRSLSNIQEDSLLSSTFANDLQGEDTGLIITDLEADIALIVVAGEGTEDIRTWAEQLHDVELPKVALVTAAVEPMTTAYLTDSAYTGYLAGYRDTASYNAARNANSREPYEVPDGIDFDLPNPETSRWHSMALGTGIAAALITLGLIFNFFRGLLRRARR